MTSRRLFAERLLPIAVLGAAITAVPVMIVSPSGLPRLHRLRDERVRASAEIARLSQRIRELRAEVGRDKRDLSAVERLARDQLGLVRRTEVVLQFDQ
jgi:cell division protein FtsB